MAPRIGVDVGGTFTDLIYYDDVSGEVRIAKVPTTPAHPEVGIANAVAAAVPAELLQKVEYFLHGTTVGLNALIERKGARIGLLATRGHRDVLEIRRGDRADPYDLFWHQPAPLVARHLRMPVGGRILADGRIHADFAETDVADAVLTFQRESVTSVAVAFLNSYVNPVHELAAAEALRKFGFRGEISLSHQVSGEYREYERTCTTVIDASVRPIMSQYLRNLNSRLAENGFRGELLLTRCGGGALTLAEAEARPFETILSGPVAGANGGAEIAEKLGIPDLITADVGGTSFDTCLIIDGKPLVMHEGSVEGLPVQTTWVDVRSIGAGGGSIAYVDVGGLLRVGPQSAGADPGPACYGRGGTLPTVTDAAFILGMLGEGHLSSEIRLDMLRARAAFEPVAAQLGMDLDQVARGVLTIANANMANAIREITVEKGKDPRESVLVAFGGAGPLFGCLLARELEIDRIVIPPYAGNFSAWGLLGADLVQSAAKTRILTLQPDSVGEMDRTLADLFALLEVRSPRSDGSDLRREVGLDMRFLGQEHTLTLNAPATADGRIGASAAALTEAFRDEYQRTFGGVLDGPVEVVTLRATHRTPLSRRAESPVLGRVHSCDRLSRRAYSFTAQGHLEFDVVNREDLRPGDRVSGPAIVLEQTATTYLDAGFEGEVHSSGSLILVTTGGSR